MRVRLFASLGAVGQRRMAEGVRAHCEVASLLAARLGHGDDVKRAAREAFARWDGKGVPTGLAGDEISRPGRLAQIAIEVAVHHWLGGVEATVAMVRRRSGKAFDPDLCDHLVGRADQILGDLATADPWDLALKAEPGVPVVIDGQNLDEALAAIGDFADLKSPYFAGHSSGVASLGHRAARLLGLPDADAILIRRASWLHDVGRVGVSVAVWDKVGPLTYGELEKVRLHP